MSTILVNTLTGTSTAGSIAVTGEGNSTTTNLQQGLVKAWMRFTGVSTTAALDSFNMSVITDGGTGNTTLGITSAMGNANFSATGYTNFDATTGADAFDADLNGRGFGLVGRSTTQIQHYAYSIDSAVNDVQIAGDLA